MSKGRKGKHRGEKSSAAPRVAPPSTGNVSTPPEKSAEKPTITPDPPRRNLPLLVISAVLLVAWLAMLLWLAVVAS